MRAIWPSRSIGRSLSRRALLRGPKRQRWFASTRHSADLVLALGSTPSMGGGARPTEHCRTHATRFNARTWTPNGVTSRRKESTGRFVRRWPYRAPPAGVFGDLSEYVMLHASIHTPTRAFSGNEDRTVAGLPCGSERAASLAERRVRDTLDGGHLHAPDGAQIATGSLRPWCEVPSRDLPGPGCHFRRRYPQAARERGSGPESAFLSSLITRILRLEFLEFASLGGGARAVHGSAIDYLLRGQVDVLITSMSSVAGFI